MYPLFRFWRELSRSRRLPGLGLLEPHVTSLTCMPWDIDPWYELNNGRTLTLYDLGRVPMGRRMGLDRVLRANGMGMAVAGSTIRYRMRVRAFDKVTMISRMLGWDERFFYVEQSMWKGQDCTSQILVRLAVTRRGARGIVPPAEVVGQITPGMASPALPAWAEAWRQAEVQRPWPPEAKPD